MSLFDPLYFTPALTSIVNLTDGSFNIIPELVYSPVTHLEVRLRGVGLFGGPGTEYGERPNDVRLELRVAPFGAGDGEGFVPKQWKPSAAGLPVRVHGRGTTAAMVWRLPALLCWTEEVPDDDQRATECLPPAAAPSVAGYPGGARAHTLCSEAVSWGWRSRHLFWEPWPPPWPPVAAEDSPPKTVL